MLCMICINFLSSNKQIMKSWWIMSALTTFFLTRLAFYISTFSVITEYIFALKPTNSSIIFPFNSSFVLPIIFLFLISVEWIFFLTPKKIKQMFISTEVFVHVICLNLIREGICINFSIDVIVVEIIHQRFRKIQDRKSHIDWSVQH